MFVLDCQINFDPMQMKSMILVSLILQILIQGYFRHLNIDLFVGLCTLLFYAINMNCEFVWRLIIFVYREFVLYQSTLSI